MTFKSNFFLLSIFVVIGFAVVQADFGILSGGGMMGGNKGCPANEKFDICGSRCPVTCANLAAPPDCRGCAKGCFCRPGYFRNAASVCVRVANCA